MNSDRVGLLNLHSVPENMSPFSEQYFQMDNIKHIVKSITMKFRYRDIRKKILEKLYIACICDI